MSDNLPEIIIPAGVPEVISEERGLTISESDHDTFGRTLRTSSLCGVCRKGNRREINLARARDHKKLGEICVEFGIPVETLKKHFDNHYIISEYNQRIIKLSEDSTPEAKELITKIFDGGTDLLDGASAVLKAKATRLNSIMARLEAHNDNMEINALEDVDKQEYVLLNRLAQDIEDSITKLYQIIDKKIFPFKKEELSNAILSYKLETLSKMLDEVKIVLMDFKKKPGTKTYTEIVEEMTMELVKRFNKLEAEVIKSGGIVMPVAQINSEDN